MSSEQLRKRRAEITPLAHAVIDALAAEATRLGLESPLLHLDEAHMSLSQDPFSGEHSLEAVWKASHGGRMGSLLFHADGSFFAEVDLLKDHPTDPRWFVEAVTAWGREEKIRTEPKLLPALGA